MHFARAMRLALATLALAACSLKHGSAPARADAAAALDAAPSPDDAAAADGGGGFDLGPLAGDLATAACTLPSAASTGVPAGTTLSAHAGNLVIDHGGVTEALDVSGDVTIAADNVVLQNSRVRGTISITGKNAVIRRCELGPDSGYVDPLIGDRNFTLLDSNLHNFGSAVRAVSNVVLRGNYFHDPDLQHAPCGVQGYATAGPGTIDIECNNIDLLPGGQFGANCSYEVTCTDTSAPPPALILRHNRFAGGSYAVYIWGVWSSIDVSDNVWAPAQYGDIWYSSYGADGKDAPLLWINNRHEDGSVIGTPPNGGGVNCKG